jgi:hypothetical protein
LPLARRGSRAAALPGARKAQPGKGVNRRPIGNHRESPNKRQAPARQPFRSVNPDLVVGDMGPVRGLEGKVAAALVAVLATWAGAAGAETVVIRPADEADRIVAAAPPGARFVFAPGLHRTGPIAARDGDRFEGEAGAVLSGAVPLYGFARAGEAWVAEVALERPQPVGQCEPDKGRQRHACRFPEDLYVGGAELARAESLDDLAPGRWYLDYATGRLHLGADPGEEPVEIALRPAAFLGAAQGVVIRGLVIEKYASPAQSGAIEGRAGGGWLVEQNEIRLNHGLGLRIGPRMTVRANLVHSNGELGIGGNGEDVVVERNVIARNNRLDFRRAWEAGATKFVKTTNLVVRGNCVHHNAGFGLWLDIDNVDALVEHNVVFDNERAGILNEIGGRATIRDNVVVHNGRGRKAWLWNAQILVANARDTTVERNIVAVARDGGHGIAIIQQSRGAGGIGPYVSVRNVVRRNVIADFSPSGVSGAAATAELEVLVTGANRFDENRYFVRSAQARRWAWNGRALDWQGLRAEGQERHGVVSEDLDEARRVLGDALVPRCPREARAEAAP